jgi:hypothetical protein
MTEFSRQPGPFFLALAPSSADAVLARLVQIGEPEPIQRHFDEAFLAPASVAQSEDSRHSTVLERYACDFITSPPARSKDSERVCTHDKVL